MKMVMCLFLPVLGFSLCSCASRVGNDALGSTLGGGVAYAVSDGDPLTTAAGAVAGLATAELVHAGEKKNDKAIALANYNLGRSDAVKQQYWLIQGNKETEAGVIRHVEYEVPVTPADPNLKTVPQTRVIRLQE